MLYWPEAPVSVGAPTVKVHGVGIAAEPLHSENVGSVEHVEIPKIARDSAHALQGAQIK